MTTGRKPFTFWCHHCKPMREFVGPKCLVQLVVHFWASHSPKSPRNDRIELVKVEGVIYKGEHDAL